MKESRTIRLLLPLLKPYAWGLPAVIVLGIVSSLAESIGLSLFVPLLQSLDRAGYQVSEPDRIQAFFGFVLSRVPAGHQLPYVAGLIFVLTLGKAVLTYGHAILVATVTSLVTHSLRSHIFSKAIEISQRSLDQIGSGRLINLLGNDTWHTSDAISTFISLVINLCSVIVFTCLLVALSWKLTLVVGLGVLLVSFVLHFVTGSARGLGRESVEANAILSNYMLDALEGVREIQMFSLARHLQRRFDEVSQRVRSVYFRLDLLHRAVSPLSEVLYIGLLIGLLLLGVKGGNSVPTVIVFLLVLYRLQPQVRQVDSARLSLASLTTAVEEVTRFLDYPADVQRESLSRSGYRTHGEIEFHHVSFAYDADLVMNDVSFHIPSGRTTAIVGPSGSGKTTLVSLLCRFYDPCFGEIRAGGKHLSALAVDEWRQQIAWVSQDAYLFSASIAENIAYGRLDATRDQIRRAAVQADADQFIRQLPDGYDTLIGNGGVKLSSGQTQRIALARAFVRQPGILILDEATNALDSISEETIQAALRQMSGEQTVIIISHRLSTLRHADRIIVLSNGRVVEQGAPRDLLSRKGLLQTLRELQHVD